jgi:hypothetical protein
MSLDVVQQDVKLQTDMPTLHIRWLSRGTSRVLQQKWMVTETFVSKDGVNTHRWDIWRDVETTED